MSSFLAYTVNGLVLGSTYALTAIGYSMVYGILELVNFTHSTIHMVGAYLFYILVSIAKLPLWLGFLLSVVLTGLIGVSYEWLTLRPLRERKQPKFAMLICTIGTSIVLQNTFFLLMGSETRQFPTIFEGKSIEIMGFNITMAQVFIIISTVVLLIAFTLFINKTRIGMAMRSCSQDTEAAELMGINVNTTISITFAIGSGLAAIAGVLLCSAYPTLMPTTGSLPGIKAFTAAVFGGIGSIPGAFIGGILLGIIEIFAKAYISTQLSDAIVFAVLIVVLVKPDGLLGKHVSEKV